MTPDPLEPLLAACLAVRDTPAVRALCGDVRDRADRDGVAAALPYAELLLDGVRAYADYEVRLRPMAVTTAGKVLGARVPTPGAGVWWLRAEPHRGGVRPVTGYAANGVLPPRATHWCEPGAGGWWSVPGAGAASEAA